MIKCELVSDSIVKKVAHWEGAKSVWHEKAKKAKEYFYNDVEGTGTTYSQSQLLNIEQNTGVKASINFLHPIISQKHAILAEPSYSFKVVALDDRGKDYAHIINKCMYAILHESQAQHHNTEAIKEMLITGMKHEAIVEKDTTNKGEFGLAYQWLPIENVVVDPNSRNPTGHDIEGYIYKKQITKDTFELTYGPLVELINSYYEKNYTIDDFLNKGLSGNSLGSSMNIQSFMGEGVCEITKIYTKRKSILYWYKNLETGEVERNFIENFFPEQAELLINEETIIKQELNLYSHVTTILGDKIVEEKFTQSTQHPIKTTYFEWGGKPYNSYGMTHFLIGMQDAIDKAFQTMILNGMLTNNAGWTAPIGSIPDAKRENWAKGVSDPRIVREYMPVVIENQVFIPKRDEVPQLSQFYPSLIMTLKEGMEVSTNINPFITGDPSGAKVEVFSTLQQYQSAAMKRINLAVKAIEYSQEYIGSVLSQLLLGNINPGFYAFFDEEGKLNELEITKEMLMDLAVSDFRILTVPSEGHPSERQQMAIELTKIAQTTPDPHEKNIYLKESFRLMEMRGYDSMQEELNEVKKLSNQVSGLQEQIKRDVELMKQYENKALNAEYKAKLLELTMDMQIKVNAEKIKAVEEIKSDSDKKSS